jgi:peptide/nickel transport system permease protein
VTEEILSRLPVTVELGILAMLILLIISLPIGVYSAIRQDSVGDYAGRSLATVLIALPNFWVGLMIIILGSLWFGWSPPLKVISFTEDPIGNLGMFIVPAFIMGMAETGTAMRMTRSMMLEVLRQDYIRTAWAKGLGERVVTMRHALKNALIPVITLIGLQIPYLLGGAVIIETIFGLPGIGRLLVEATLERDYTIVSGVVFSFAVLLILTNIVVDLTYGYLDPRVRYK